MPVPDPSARSTRRRRRWLIAGVAVLCIVALVVAASFFVDEPLRRYLERHANNQLHGYSLRIERLSFHPFNFAIDFYGLVMRQAAHPDPAIADVDHLHASVQWRALLRGRLVADFLLERPTIYVDRTHFLQELRDPVPVREHGWQDALQALYPLKINEFRIVGGAATYVDRGPYKPLTLSHIDVRAGNIRNVFSPERVYPSDLALRAVVFGTGRLALDGNADFMAEPEPGVKAHVALDGIDVGYFAPILQRYNVTVKRGMLSADGDVEYAATVKTADLRKVTIDGVALDYVHSPKTATQEAAVAKAGVEVAREVGNAPGLLLRLAKLDVVRSTLGYVDQSRTPAFRAYLSDASISMANLTNQKSQGAAEATIRGKFMGSGTTEMIARFVPTPKTPDVSVDLKVVDASLPAMNDLLRSVANVDVVAGEFSVYSEMHVKNGWVQGYVKPLIHDVRAYDPEQDRDKSFGTRLKKRAIDLAGKLLKNRHTEAVATRAEISGPADSVRARTWQIVRGLLRNAFVRAILPGFESDGTTKTGGNRAAGAARTGRNAASGTERASG